MRRYRIPLICSQLVLLLGLGACAVPAHMEVRRGIDPNHEDDNVRFRTTYYMRVVDYCRDANNERNKIVSIPMDTLYRFRMTGQAGALGSTVHFESGLLHKDLIDPFGNNMEIDPKTNRPMLVTFDERMQEKKDIKILEATDRVIDSLKKNGVDTKQLIVTAPKDKLSKVYEGLAESISNRATHGIPPGPPPLCPTPPCPKPDLSNVCADNSPLQHGYQIYGPQGVATFDQDMRLVLVMSSEATPLISSLKQASALAANTYRQDLGPIIQKERYHELQLRNELHKKFTDAQVTKNKWTSDTVFDTAIKKLQGGNP